MVKINLTSYWSNSSGIFFNFLCNSTLKITKVTSIPSTKSENIGVSSISALRRDNGNLLLGSVEKPHIKKRMVWKNLYFPVNTLKELKIDEFLEEIGCEIF